MFQSFTCFLKRITKNLVFEMRLLSPCLFVHRPWVDWCAFLDALRSLLTLFGIIFSDRQGTVGLELVEQVKELTEGAALDAVIVPVGGGGLISGVATAVKSLCPGIRVIGAEPQKAADAFRSKQVRVCDASIPENKHACLRGFSMNGRFS